MWYYINFTYEKVRDRAQWHEMRIGNTNTKYITWKLFRPLFACKIFTRMRYVARNVFNSVGVTLAGCISRFNIIIEHEQCAECFAFTWPPSRRVLRVYKIRAHPNQWCAHVISGVTLSAALARNLRLIATYNFFFGTSEGGGIIFGMIRAPREGLWFILSFHIVCMLNPRLESGDITGRGTL